MVDGVHCVVATKAKYILMASFPVSKEVCPIIIIYVGNARSLQCDGLSARWFHIGCLKMMSTEYATYVNDKNKSMYCSCEDCVKPENTNLVHCREYRLGALETKLDLIFNTFSTLATKDEISKMADSIKILTA